MYSNCVDRALGFGPCAAIHIAIHNNVAYDCTSNDLQCRPCSSMSLKVCHGRGRGFESRRPRRSFQKR
jgi:hypothetical protein